MAVMKKIELNFSLHIKHYLYTDTDVVEVEVDVQSSIANSTDSILKIQIFEKLRRNGCYDRRYSGERET